MVSIIIPTYNRADTIRKSIDSILEQTYTNFELIIVDDGSTDNTEEIVHSVNDERLKYVKHMVNRGACAARNTGIDVAIGEYIAFQDSDDVWHNDKLKKQLNVLKLTDADIVFCNLVVGNHMLHYKQGFLQKGDNVFGIGTPTILGKASIFKEIKFDERMPRFQELEILLRIHEKYTMYFHDEILIDCCCSGNGISTSPMKLLQACELLLEIHPSLEKQYKEVACNIANLLLNESQLVERSNKKERKKMRNLALKYSLKMKILVKYFLLSINITWKRDAKGYIILGKNKEK